MNQTDLIEAGAVTCKRCHGIGVITCFTCSGRGKLIKVTYGFPTSSSACSSCSGTGVKRICEMCEGQGVFFSKANI